MKPLTEDERYQLNFTNSHREPHPDGKPWDKCCTAPTDSEYQCQCLMRKPRKDQSRWDRNKRIYDDTLHRMAANNGRFFCVHRTTEDGYYRECAGWAAKYGSKKCGKDSGIGEVAATSDGALGFFYVLWTQVKSKLSFWTRATAT